MIEDLRFAQNCNKKCGGGVNQVPDFVRQQEHSGDLSSDTTLSNLSRLSRNRVSIPRNHVIANQFGHATHSAAVRSFP
jgi:hypothetical protein